MKSSPQDDAYQVSSRSSLPSSMFALHIGKYTLQQVLKLLSKFCTNISYILLSLHKTQRLLYRKGINQCKYTRVTPHIIHAVYNKLTAKIYINGEKHQGIPLKSGTEKSYPISPHLDNIVLEVLSKAIRQLKKTS